MLVEMETRALNGAAVERARTFRYVKIRDIDAYLALGWFFDGDVMHMPHGVYSVIMEWLCSECPPIEPKKPPGTKIAALMRARPAAIASISTSE